MRWCHLIANFKNSLVFSGGLGVLLGFVVTNILISYHEQPEEIISLGDIEADTSNPDAITVASTVAGTDRLSGKILCMVISALDGEKAKIVNNTWGKRCDRLIFFTSRKADSLDTILLPEHIEDKWETLWEKVKYGFSHAYSTYYDFDWFLKADDDTYVVMENLKVFLSGYNSSEAMYFGCRLTMSKNPLTSIRDVQNDTLSGYMSGGSGYVLSKEALRLFVEVALAERNCFDGIVCAEDVNMGHCLDSVNVSFMDTRDYFGRHRFFPISPFFVGYLRPRLQHDNWYYRKMYYPTNDGKECCAESAITFHYVNYPYMDLIEFFLHHLSPYQHY